MLISLAKPIADYARLMTAASKPKFDGQDVAALKLDGPRNLRLVQQNLRLGKEPLADMEDTDKKILMAYVIFLRQNVTMSDGDSPNVEDAAAILHGKVFGESKEKGEFEDELLKQLKKIGLKIEDKDEEKTDKTTKKKGE